MPGSYLEPLSREEEAAAEDVNRRRSFAEEAAEIAKRRLSRVVSEQGLVEKGSGVSPM